MMLALESWPMPAPLQQRPAPQQVPRPDVPRSQVTQRRLDREPFPRVRPQRQAPAQRLQLEREGVGLVGAEIDVGAEAGVEGGGGVHGGRCGVGVGAS